MADAAAIELEDDYYSILNVPRGTGLHGLQTAYARLADDLAGRMGVDPTARDELIRLNRAFAVLGNSELRKRYDAQYFAEEIAQEDQDARVDEKRTRRSSNLIFAALLFIVIVQGVVVGYVEREALGNAAATVLGPLAPGGAN